MNQKLAVLGLVVASAMGISSLHGDEPQVIVTPLADAVAVGRTARSSEEAIQEALKKRIDVKFEETPLNEAITFIGSAAGLKNVRLNQTKLNDEGVAVDTAVTFAAEQATAGQVLHRVLNPLGLAWVVRFESLEVTTQVTAEEVHVTRTYDVGALLKRIRSEHEKSDKSTPPSNAAGFPAAEFDAANELLNVLQNSTHGPWFDIDGTGGRVSVNRNLIVVRQSQLAQEDFAAVLKGIVLFSEGGLENGVGTAAPAWVPADSEVVIREALMRRLPTVEFAETPLNEVVQFLKDKLAISVLIDRVALEESGVSVDQPITLKGENLTGQSIFEQILEPLELTAKNDHGSLMVTTKVKAEEILVTKIYDVRGLHDQDENRQPNFQRLIDLLQNETSGPWNDVDGTGGVVHSPLLGCLVIRQTEKVHDEVAEVLEQLRERAEPEPAAGEKAPEANEDPEKIETRFYPIVRKGVAEQMAKAIPNLIAREAWGADGMVIEVVDGTLLVRQSVKVHREIQKFLKNLKAAEDAPME